MNKATVTKWASVAVIVGAIMLFMRSLPLAQLQSTFCTWIDSLGIWGPVVFGVIYIIATVCLIPGALVTLAGGAVFGLWIGFITVSLSSTIGAAIAFLIARYLARSKVEQVARSNERFGAIDEAISEGGWKIVGLLRLSPAIPFALQNYLYGLTDIKFVHYVLVSWIAMMPGTFLYVYLGYIGGIAATGSDDGTIWKWALLIVGLIATIVVTVYITRLARRKLEETKSKGRDSTRQENGTKAKEEGATGFPVKLALAAAASLFLALLAFSQQGCISNVLAPLLGPPQVAMQEKYQAKPVGPEFDHSTFAEVLELHVQEGGWVNYKALQMDSTKLDEYIACLDHAPFDEMGRNQKLALLINAYNAFTLKLITEHYPLDSIKDIPSDKRWEDKRWKVAGKTWSLNQIEHEQIRPNFKEPRIHFVLVCAAVGCPPLATDVFSAEKIEAQLKTQTEYVHSHETWLQIKPYRNKVSLTSLYDWYGGDFEQASGTVLKFAAQYNSELARVLDGGKPPTVEFLKYSWKLNSVENKEKR